MVSVNLPNFITVGLLALVFFIVASWAAKTVGVNVPGLPA